MEIIKTYLEIKKFKFLLQQTVIREIRVRYKQTYIGILWAILQPLAFSCIFYFLFSYIKGGLNSKEHFIILFFSTSLWTFFSNSVSFATNSISGHPSLITKVYFPRIIFPMSFVAVSLIDLSINLLLATVLHVILLNQIPNMLNFVYVIPAIAFIIILTLNCAVLLSGLNVFYRDFKYLVPISLQLLMFITPVMYTMNSNIGENIKSIIIYNPLTPLFDIFQKSIINIPVITEDIIRLLVVGLITILFFEFNLRFFKKLNSKMADII